MSDDHSSGTMIPDPHPGNPASAHVDTTNVVSVSTVFPPTNREGGALPDTVLGSTDGVLFYVNIQAIRMRVPTAFSTVIPLVPSTQARPASAGVIATSCDSVTLTLILQALYGLSSVSIAPSVDAINRALDSMLPNGIDPKAIIQPNTSLYGLLLEQIPTEPMKVYVTAAQLNMEELARRASSHLLGVELRQVDDAMAQKMGPIYLKRLFALHEERISELKSIIIQPPDLHQETDVCSIERQGSLRTEWALCIVRVLQDARPSISPFALGRSFEYGLTNVTCADCRSAWTARTDAISKLWAAVKHTI